MRNFHAGVIRAKQEECKDDKFVMIGYSWGGYMVVQALRNSYRNKAGFAVKPFHIDLVYTIDPVAGNPATDDNKTQFGGYSKDGVDYIYGNFDKGYNWYQESDLGDSLTIGATKIPIWGRKTNDPRFTNKMFAKADFATPDGAHVEIVTKKVIRDAIQKGIQGLL